LDAYQVSRDSQKEILFLQQKKKKKNKQADVDNHQKRKEGLRRRRTGIGPKQKDITIGKRKPEQKKD